MHSRLTPRLREWHWVHLGLLATLPAYWFAQRSLDLPAIAGLMLWLAITIASLLLAEKFAPYRDDWHPDLPDLKRDAGMLSLNIVADGVADVIVLGAAVVIAPGTSNLPFVTQVLAGIFIAELGSYLLHRLSHKGRWLWRVHVVHHLPTAVNATNSFNAHPINALYNKIVRVAPLVLLGVSADAIFIVALFGLTQGMVVHANVRGRLGFLNWILGSAELHRLHHSLDRDQARNFGTTVPLWDQVFGTYRAPETVQQVGVADARAYPDPSDLRALLRFPLEPAHGPTGRPWSIKRCCAWAITLRRRFPAPESRKVSSPALRGLVWPGSARLGPLDSGGCRITIAVVRNPAGKRTFSPWQQRPAAA